MNQLSCLKSYVACNDSFNQKHYFIEIVWLSLSFRVLRSDSGKDVYPKLWLIIIISTFLFYYKLSHMPCLRATLHQFNVSIKEKKPWNHRSLGKNFKFQNHRYNEVMEQAKIRFLKGQECKMDHMEEEETPLPLAFFKKILPKTKHFPAITLWWAFCY